MKRKAKPGEVIKQKCAWCGKIYYKSPSQANVGKNNFCSRYCRSKFTGKKLSESAEYKEKMRLIALRNGNIPPEHKGANHWNWKGGISKKNRGEDGKYKKWRKNVLRNYNYTCAFCGTRGGRLSAHHMFHWSEYPGLRYDENNGVCVCYDTHMYLHGLGGKDCI